MSIPQFPSLSNFSGQGYLEITASIYFMGQAACSLPRRKSESSVLQASLGNIFSQIASCSNFHLFSWFLKYAHSFKKLNDKGHKIVQMFMGVQSGFMFNTYRSVFIYFQKICLELLSWSPKWWKRCDVAELLVHFFFLFQKPNLFLQKGGSPLKTWCVVLIHQLKENRMQTSTIWFPVSNKTNWLRPSFYKKLPHAPHPPLGNSIALTVGARFNSTNTFQFLDLSSRLLQITRKTLTF